MKEEDQFKTDIRINLAYVQQDDCADPPNASAPDRWEKLQCYIIFAPLVPIQSLLDISIFNPFIDISQWTVAVGYIT